MKKGMRLSVKIVIAVLLLIVLFVGYLGFIPGVSAIFGSNKPRNLGVTYTEADRTSARAKSQIAYEALPAGTPDEMSLQRTGSQPANFNLTSAEATALMNNRPYKYWPFENVQMKFNSDSSAEVSGTLNKSKVPGYAAAIGVPKNVAEEVVKFLPSNPVFYVKARAALKDNKVSLLEPSKVEIGRLSIPVGWILSFNTGDIAYAADDLQTELNQYSGKKAAIVNYINNHLASISGFFAKSASFAENSLHFDGNLNEKELTVR